MVLVHLRMVITQTNLYSHYNNTSSSSINYVKHFGQWQLTTHNNGANSMLGLEFIVVVLMVMVIFGGHGFR